MYYFLGLVTTRNLVSGNIVPDYILSSFNSFDLNYAPWRVVRRGRTRETMPRVLTTSLYGRENDMMIDFMSNYRTRINSKSYKKFYPKGALFWFECDKQGNRTGSALFIKKVPQSHGRLNDDKWKRMAENLMHDFTAAELLTRTPTMTGMEQSDIKPRLIQFTGHKERYKPAMAELIKHRKSMQLNIKRRCAYGKNSGAKEGRNSSSSTGKRSKGDE